MIPEFDATPQFTPGKTPPADALRSPPDVALPTKAEPVDELIAVGPFEVSLEFALDTWCGGYTPQNFEQARISQTRLTLEQAVALKLLALSLNKQNARMSNGRFVQCSTDAVRYLLDQIAAALPAEMFEDIQS